MSHDQAGFSPRMPVAGRVARGKTATSLSIIMTGVYLGGRTSPTAIPATRLCASYRIPLDLDCKDIPYRRFKVLPPDPHNFDGDGDGIGCES